jgi:hypothetical protein
MADAGFITALAIEAAAADKMTWTVLEPGLSPTFFGVLVTVAIDYDTQTLATLVNLDKRITYGSDTGRIELAEIEIPDGAVAGSVFLYRIGAHSTVAVANQQRCIMAQQLICEVSQAGTGGGSIAGDYQPFVIINADPEQFTNMSNVTIVND